MLWESSWKEAEDSWTPQKKQRPVELSARDSDQPITWKRYLATRCDFFRLCRVLQGSSFPALSHIVGWALVMQMSNVHFCSCKLSLIHIPISNPNNTYSFTIWTLVMPIVLYDIASLSRNEKTFVHVFPVTASHNKYQTLSVELAFIWWLLSWVSGWKTWI